MISPETAVAVNKLVQGIPFQALRDGRLDEKVIEVVVRRADGKIAQFAKCAVENGSTGQSLAGVLSNVPSIGGVSTVSSLANNMQTQMVYREVKQVKKDVREVLDLTKDMSVNIDRMAKGMSVVQGLSFLNAALSVANLGITITGFSKVNQRLDELYQEVADIRQTLQDIQRTAGELKRIKILEVVNGGHALIDKTAVLFQHRSDGVCGTEEYESVLGDHRTYLRLVQNLMSAGILDFETGYQLSMNLLRGYTEILTGYLEEYYYSHDHHIPQLYQTYLDTICSFAAPQFMSQLFDHLYLDRDLSKTDAQKSKLCHFMLVSNAYTRAEDTRELLLQLPEQKDYADLQARLEQDAENRVNASLSAR